MSVAPASGVGERIRAWIAANPSFRSVAPNAGWMIADRVLRMVLGLGVGAAVARTLGPAGYGALQYPLALVTLVSPLATLGMERIVVRELIVNPAAAGEILGSMFGLRLAGSLITLAIAVAVALVLRPGDAATLIMVVIFALAFIPQAFELLEQWFQSRQRARDAVPATSAAFVVGAASRVACIVARAPLPAYALAGLIEATASALGLSFLARASRGGPGRWSWSTARARALLRDGWPMVATGFMILVYMRIDQIMLGQLSTPAELGAYSAAVKLVEVWYFLPTAIAAAAHPLIVEARALGDEIFYRRLQRFYNAMALAGYAVAIPGCLLARWVVRWIYGGDFDAAAPMLAVLVWSLLFTNLGVARGTFLAAMNLAGSYLMTAVLGAIVNVLLNLVLIPRWGGMGAVIASLVAYWLAAHGSCYFHRPLFRTGNMLTRALLMPDPR